MAVSRKRSSTINRIRYYNNQVDKQNRVRLNKTLSIKQLNQLERDIKTTTYLGRLEVEGKAVNVEARNVPKIKRLSQAFQRKDTDAFEKEINKIFDSNKRRFETVRAGVKDVKGIGVIDFTIEGIKERPKSLQDVETVLNVIVNEDFVTDILEDEIVKLNEQKGVQEIGEVDRGNIGQLGKRARQWLINVRQSPKLLSELSIAEDDFDLVD
jgi:hypothetical protein